MNTLCIAHGSNCVDGHASAWVVHHALGTAVDFHFASYGQEPPDVAGRDVVIVDFSYKRAILEEMARSARSVLVLDHHKSAAEDLAGLCPAPRGTPSDREWIHPTSGWTYWQRAISTMDKDSDALLGNFYLAALFDMDRSGAGITWDFFNPGLPRPWFIDLVEDRDLWRFADPRSRPFHAAAASYPLDFALWDRLYAEVLHNSDLINNRLCINEEMTLLQEGRAILRKHDLDVQQVIATTRRAMVIGGVRVPVCNCPPWLASDVGHALVTEPVEYGLNLAGGKVESVGMLLPPFAASYYDRDGRRCFSLRSRPDGADVSEVAKLYRGGGHRNAAGFERPQGWEGKE